MFRFTPSCPCVPEEECSACKDLIANGSNLHRVGFGSLDETIENAKKVIGCSNQYGYLTLVHWYTDPADYTRGKSYNLNVIPAYIRRYSNILTYFTDPKGSICAYKSNIRQTGIIYNPRVNDLDIRKELEENPEFERDVDKITILADWRMCKALEPDVDYCIASYTTEKTENNVQIEVCVNSYKPKGANHGHRFVTPEDGESMSHYFSRVESAFGKNCSVSFSLDISITFDITVSCSIEEIIAKNGTQRKGTDIGTLLKQVGIVKPGYLMVPTMYGSYYAGILPEGDVLTVYESDSVSQDLHYYRASFNYTESLTPDDYSYDTMMNEGIMKDVFKEIIEGYSSNVTSYFRFEEFYG